MGCSEDVLTLVNRTMVVNRQVHIFKFRIWGPRCRDNIRQIGFLSVSNRWGLNLAVMLV